MNPLTHFDAQGQAQMVDVSKKQPTHRSAIAQGRIRMARATFEQVAAGRAAKGDVLGVARVAAIQAAKKTSDLIPLCHPLPLTRVTVEFILEPQQSAGASAKAPAEPCAVLCRCSAETVGVTGVEMEALTAVQIGLLTIYDMCKAMDKAMTITDVRLLEKHGGKSGSFVAQGDMLNLKYPT